MCGKIMRTDMDVFLAYKTCSAKDLDIKFKIRAQSLL
jgi:hypothetical protein